LVADGGIGVTTGSVKSLRKVRGDGGSLFAGRRNTAESVKMGAIAVPLIAFAVAMNQEFLFHAPDLGRLRKIARDVRRRSFIWEIPA
jgi:hypothetical protein